MNAVPAPDEATVVSPTVVRERTLLERTATEPELGRERGTPIESRGTEGIVREGARRIPPWVVALAVLIVAIAVAAAVEVLLR
jgi:hypothetical protein